MTSHATLCLVLHNHQPIGNFDGVIESAYQDSYLPFLTVFEQFERLKLSLHTSGPLMQWLVERHPEYIDRLRLLVDSGRIEILGGPQYEPILTMLPRRDRVGQIKSYTHFLHNTLGVVPRGMWMPERVWESSLTTDVADSGIQYTVLDDYHFKAAGLRDEELTGHFVTEDAGRMIRVFPGSERLRYTIPFQSVDETINHCRDIAQRSPGAVLTFGDDGEKFGTWPDTKPHVYENGWLAQFFAALSDNADWLRTSTLGEAVDQTQPAGKVYLPDCSYREMTQWALPAESQQTLESGLHDADSDPKLAELRPFLRGGFWRNFKVKYDETNEMYARMMHVSSRLAAAEAAGADHGELAEVRHHLYRGQCNCPYWHGAFGGIYLPHLRNAVYQELITADTLLDRITGLADGPVDVTVSDFNFDGNNEVKLSNDKLCAWVAPTTGGRIYELDVRQISHNLLATLQRRPESYHAKILRGDIDGGDSGSIHDRVVCKQEGLDQRLQYDRFARKSLMDHFYNNDITIDDVAGGNAEERADFIDQPFAAKLHRSDSKIQLRMTREGRIWDSPATLTKAVTMESGSERLTCTYLFEGLPPELPLHFAVELNFAGLPAGADDRYFSDTNGDRLGQLGETLDLKDVRGLGLSDRWLGIDVNLNIDRPSGIWAFPIQTVSQSEAGFELVHQSVCVQPHWIIAGDQDGRWSVEFEIDSKCEAVDLSPQSHNSIVVSPN